MELWQLTEPAQRETAKATNEILKISSTEIPSLGEGQGAKSPIREFP